MRSNPSSEEPRLVAANGGGGGDANGLTVQTRAPLLREESLMSGAGKKNPAVYTRGQVLKVC